MPLDWERLWSHFHAALELPESARAAWLDQQVADSLERAEIDSLLAAHGSEHASLDGPAVPVAEGWIAAAPAAGERLGAWRLLRVLGQGGMGSVWLAQRDDGVFSQQAAIKLVNAALATPTLLARFRRERQILATLEHPDIARVIDGGLSTSGLPWLAMERVEGISLERWWRTRAPSLERRLRLMVRLCAAVHFAHQQLVVHRDLKPSNVLVDEDDRPVLLDFGVAKLLEGAIDAERTGTQLPLAFTPRYASPEQLQGRPVGTASDIYSLGLMLYEMLSDAAPFGSPDTSWGAYVANVMERTPAPPSQRAALTFGVELDAIVLMALRKEPDRRYLSAAALAEDLQRYLTHEPVRARPNSALYRGAKFVRRHRMGVGLSVLAAMLLMGLGSRLIIEGERTREALIESARERARSEHTVGFLTELFREADPTRGNGEVISARELLVRGSELLNARTLEPATRAAILSVLGETLVNAGDYARAAALFRESLSLSATVEQSQRLRADALHGLGGAEQQAAKHLEARHTLQQAVVARQAAYGESSIEVAATRQRLGSAEQSLGNFDAAEQAFTLALQTHRAQRPAHDSQVADSLLLLGSLAWSRGRYALAEPYYREALALRRRQPERSAELARTLDAVGALAHVQGRHLQAEPLYQEALALRRRVLGDAHRLTADTLGNLGSLAYDRGDFHAAISHLSKALATQQTALGSDSPVVAKSLNNLALAEAALGLRESASTRLQQALAINRKAFGERHLRVAGNLNNLGLVLLEGGDATAAESKFRESAAITASLTGADDPQIGFALNNRARALLELGRWQDAAAEFERVLLLRRKQLDPAHPALAETLAWYGLLRCEYGNPGSGKDMLDAALAIRESRFGSDHPTTRQTRVMLSLCDLDGGETARAERLGKRGAQALLDDPATGQPLRRRLVNLPNERTESAGGRN